MAFSGMPYVTVKYNCASLEGSRLQKCNRDICVAVLLGFTNTHTHTHTHTGMVVSPRSDDIIGLWK